MIVAFLDHKGGVGKTTLALHVAGAWAAQGKRIVLVNTDAQGSALDWSEQRAKERMTRLFDVLELARDTVHLEAPEIACDIHHVVIDGSPHSAAPMRSAMLAADLALVPAQPSPSTAGRRARRCGCFKSMALRPQPVARLALNRCVVRWLLAGHWPDMTLRLSARRLASVSLFADAARTGPLVAEMPRGKPTAREVAALAAEIERIAR
jgi:chromosome partitioning protein